MTTINIKMIKDYIEIHKLTIAEFCKKADISISVYKKIVTGKTNFRYINLVKVANLLRVPFSLLAGF